MPDYSQLPKKHLRPLIAALILLLLPTIACAQQAGSTGNTGIELEVSRQESIYHSRGELRLEGYVIDRSLSSYGDALAHGFERALAALGPQDRWLDIGAGQGLAILDYYAPVNDSAPAGKSSSKAHAVAMSIEDRRTPRWKQTASLLGTDQLQYLYSKRLREYSTAEIGKFQIISDVIGGFSYTEDLSLFMEKVLGMLTVNGNFYGVLQDVRSEQGLNKPHYAGAPFLTEVRAAGEDIGVCAWLKRISCVEVSCHLQSDWVPQIESYRVRKLCDDVKVPALERFHFISGTPPERGFRLISPMPTKPAAP